MNPEWQRAAEVLRRAKGLRDEGKVLVRNFSQCGKSEHNMDWLRQALEAQRDPNLFYPDEEHARQRAEALRRQYQITTPYSADQIDRLVEWMCLQYSQPRPINLNISPLAVAIHNVYSR